MKTSPSAAEPSPRKRRLFRHRACFLLVLVAVVAFLPFLTFPFGKRLKTENFSKIQAGMTRAQVEVILGGVAGNYGMDKDTVVFITTTNVLATNYAGTLGSDIWYDDQTQIDVTFWRNGTVYSCKMKSSPRMDRWLKFWRGAYKRLGGML